MKGEFESRLRQVIEEVQALPKAIILFIDEAHTLIGAGGTAGQGDAANLLKPALARGTLRTIAATTWAEYKKYFEKDPALTRRFQVIKVDEPSEGKVEGRYSPGKPIWSPAAAAVLAPQDAAPHRRFFCSSDWFSQATFKIEDGEEKHLRIVSPVNGKYGNLHPNESTFAGEYSTGRECTFSYGIPWA
jgi:hypothetical protein